MTKTKKLSQVKTLQLKKETVIHLGDAALAHVVGGVNSTRRSQCVTLCF